jgi:hypothetical protein
VLDDEDAQDGERRSRRGALDERDVFGGVDARAEGMELEFAGRSGGAEAPCI